MLAEIGDLDVMPGSDLAAVMFIDSGQKFNQGRFASAIDADNPKLFSPLQFKREVGEDLLFLVTLGNCFG
jgi:hypothetical protein